MSANPPVPRSISVWRSVRADGDTKTQKSRRTLAMPIRCVVALRPRRIRQRATKLSAGKIRHSFVSLLSDAKVSIEDISRLCGHGFRQAHGYSWSRSLRSRSLRTFPDSLRGSAGISSRREGRYHSVMPSAVK